MKYLLLVLCLILCSCVTDNSPIVGDCVPITLNELSFNEQEKIDSIIVYKSDDYAYRWWFSDIQGKEYTFITPEKIECSWFSAEKASLDNIIIVKIKQNDTGEKRDAEVRINTNDDRGEKCSENRGWLRITQCPEPIDIEQSKEELLFSFEGGVDAVIITTNRSSWLNEPLIGVWYNEPSTNEWGYEYIHYVYNANRKDFDYSNKPDVNTWFTIDVIDGKEIIFSVSKNESGEKREADINFDLYNCGTNIKIIQSAE